MKISPALRGVWPVLVAIAVLAVLQWLLGDAPFFVYIASIVGVNIILAVSLNIVNGMTGQFSIGHAGFMAVGAYIAGKFSLELKDVAISGVVVQNVDAFGRALGLSGIPQTSSLFAVYFVVFLVVLVSRRLVASTHGRSLWAIREDEVAAEAMGVNTTAYKVRAFVISSFFAGVAGGLFAHFVPIINPGSFTFVKSIEIVVMVVAGGLGSTTGAIVAAVVLTLLPEALRSLFLQIGGLDAGGSLAQKVDQIRMPIYGILLVILMLSRPQGLFGTREIWDVFPRWFSRFRRPA